MDVKLFEALVLNKKITASIAIYKSNIEFINYEKYNIRLLF